MKTEVLKDERFEADKTGWVSSHFCCGRDRASHIYGWRCLRTPKAQS
jgi:hypothetical protein